MKNTPLFNIPQTILLITNDAEIRNVCESYYAHENYQTITESTPLDGLQTSRLLAPAMILLDLDLPNDELLKLCSELRTTTNGTLLLILPQSHAISISEYLSVGVDECISRPVNLMALLIKSITWLARQDWIVPRRQISLANS